MVFIPQVPFIPPEQATLEAQELARDIEDAIVRYQEDHPAVRQEDIRQALSIATSRAGTGITSRQEIRVALIVGLTLMLVLTSTAAVLLVGLTTFGISIFGYRQAMINDLESLAQVVGQYDFKQDWQLLLALNLPFGSAGTEFGGLDTPVEGKQFSSGPGIFAQLAFYF